MRTWKQYYTVLSGPELCFYKDRKDLQHLNIFVTGFEVTHNYKYLEIPILIINYLKYYNSGWETDT